MEDFIERTAGLYVGLKLADYGLKLPPVKWWTLERSMYTVCRSSMVR